MDRLAEQSGDVIAPMAPGAELDGARLDAELFFPAQIKPALTRWRSGFPITNVSDKDVQVIEGFGPQGTRVKLFFDQLPQSTPQLSTCPDSPSRRPCQRP